MLIGTHTATRSRHPRGPECATGARSRQKRQGQALPVLPGRRSPLLQGTLGEGEIFGQVALATPDLAVSGVSEHLLRIQARGDDENALLYAYLSTLVGRRLLRSTGVGTKLLSLRHDLLL